jgi:hypothetical protein
VGASFAIQPPALAKALAGGLARRATHPIEMRDPNDLFAALEKSTFRRRFRLSPKDLAYAREHGLDTLLDHARNFIRDRLASANPANDGKQTPMRNHPVFVAQHATATCCRGCLEKWHHVPRGRALPQAEQDHVIATIERWLRNQGVGDAEQGRLF